jgi:hypothetical protein
LLVKVLQLPVTRPLDSRSLRRRENEMGDERMTLTDEEIETRRAFAAPKAEVADADQDDPDADTADSDADDTDADTDADDADS